jgi:hypothetical protein
VPSLFFGVLWRQSVHEKKKKSKNRFPHLPCVCVSIHRWYELVHAYMKDTHLFIEIDARKKHERRMQTHNNRTKKAKWVLSDFAKWHASSNSKFIWPPLDHYTTLLSRLRRLGKYIHNVRKRSKEFRPASKSSKSFSLLLLPIPTKQLGGKRFPNVIWREMGERGSKWVCRLFIFPVGSTSFWSRVTWQSDSHKDCIYAGLSIYRVE